jgi:hypothetical protein
MRQGRKLRSTKRLRLSSDGNLIMIRTCRTFLSHTLATGALIAVALVCASLWSKPVFAKAKDAPDETYHGTNSVKTSDLQIVAGLMQRTLNEMHGLDLKRAEDACNRVRAPGAAPDNRCIQRYLKIYENPIVDMRLVFGYKNNDLTGGVDDGTMRGAVIDRLTAPCPPAAANVFACGFRRDRDDAEIFYKDVVSPRGERRLVKLAIVQSSYSNRDSQNRKENQQAQERQSAHARQIFLDGLKSADVVLYNGHSRDSGGPDFSPAVLNAAGHTNYAWYHTHRVGLNDMTQALKKPGKHTASVIGLLSCYSERFFYHHLKQLAPDSGFLMTRGYSWWPDEPATIIGALNGLLGQVCEPGFSKGVNLNGNMDPTSRVYPDNLF